MLFTVRCVLAPGEATIVVVVAVVIRTFVLPGVMVVPLISTQADCTCMSAVVEVVTRRRSDVDERMIMLENQEV